MSKRTYMQKLYGDAADDEAPVLHYGNVDVTQDVNRGQVQPIWSVITSHLYTSREMQQPADPDQRGGFRKVRELTI